MKRISEHTIEQYIRFSYELSTAKKEEIRKAIEESAEAKKIYEFLVKYYQELDRLSDTRTSIISLKAFRYDSKEPGPVVLAAMTSEQKKRSLTTKATLVSEEYKTLVRVLEKEADHSLQFHVISGDSDRSRYAILSLVNPEIDLVTDQNGKLKDVRNLSDLNWDSISSILRVPVMLVEVDPKKTEAFRLANQESVGLGLHGKTLEVHLSEEKTRFSRMLLVQEEYSELKVINQQKLSFELPSVDKECTLCFYE
ncbi:hypothetical protein [Gracilimonas tropica]|uniref:hypothetical protein n=1 Tax=Gracilimonas tropica TaxID=454600 RepID=UPI000377E60A|nr:hypothetical protein [Gracilimonas tropica]